MLDIYLFFTKSSFSFTYRVGGALLALAVTVLLVRWFGLVGAGYYYLFVSLTSVLAMVSRMGIDDALVREFARLDIRRDKNQMQQAYYSSLYTVCVLAVGFSGVLMLVSCGLRYFNLLSVDLFVLLLLVCVNSFFLNLTAFHANLLKSQDKIQYSSLFVGFAPHLLAIPLLWAAKFVGSTQLSFLGVFVIVNLVLAVVSFFLWQKTVQANFCNIKEMKLVRFQYHFMMINLLDLVNANLLIWFFSTNQTMEVLGGIGILLKLLNLFSFVPEAINTAFAPRVASLSGAKHWKKLKRLFLYAVASVMFLNGVLLTLYLLIPSYILSLFSTEMLDYRKHLQALAIIFFMHSIFIPTATMFTMTRFERLFSYSSQFALGLAFVCIALLYFVGGFTFEIIYGFIAVHIIKQVLQFLFIWNKLNTSTE